MTITLQLPALAVILTLAACGAPGDQTPDAPTVVDPPEASAEPTPADPPTDSGIRTEEIAYMAGDTALRGYLAMPTGNEGNVPGVIVVHEWWGHNGYARDRAEELARQGYAAFALDMYGDGKLAAHPGDAAAFMTEVLGDADLVAARFHAALGVLHGQDGVDTERTAAIGYCMGGAVVLGMARSGEDLDAVVSLHGILATNSLAEKGVVKARILVCTGAADPLVPDEVVTAFRLEMERVDVDYQIVEYADAMHAFTNPAATALGEEFKLPLRYDADADADSWARTLELFDQVF